MEQIISKKEIDELMKIKGEVRGGGMKSYVEFIFKEKGKEGLKELEDMMEKLGYPIKYKEMGTLKFYPIRLEAVTLLAIKRLFNYDDEKFQEMAKFALKLPFIIRRVFMKYLFSPQKLIKEAPEMWKIYYTAGDLEIGKYNVEKRYMIVRLENFHAHPLQCHIIKGYISSALQIIHKSPVSCEETKCVHRGDEYHEFLIKW